VVTGLLFPRRVAQPVPAPAGKSVAAGERAG
jgi:hypothetical protein